MKSESYISELMLAVFSRKFWQKSLKITKKRFKKC
jgi:hypothetical protein